MTLDLSLDYLIFDRPITVTLTDNTGPQVIENVLKSEKTDKVNSPSDGVYQSNTGIEFQFPTSIVRPPVIGGTILDNLGQTYTILEVREPFLNDFWGASVKEMVLDDEFSLVDLVSLWRHSTITDSYTSDVVSHTESVSNISAKIQLKESQAEDIIGKREFNRQYEIFLSIEIPDGWCSYRDLIKDEALNIYTIRSWKNRDQIDELSILFVEKQVN